MHAICARKDSDPWLGRHRTDRISFPFTLPNEATRSTAIVTPVHWHSNLASCSSGHTGLRYVARHFTCTAALVAHFALTDGNCWELTTLCVVRLNDDAELKVTDPKEQQRDVEEEEAKDEKRRE